jgi:hypothetical protein
MSLYYHYTTVGALEPILHTNELNECWTITKDDVVEDGVYLTTLDPFDNDFDTVLVNNSTYVPHPRPGLCLEFDVHHNMSANVGVGDRKMYRFERPANELTSFLKTIYFLDEDIPYSKVLGLVTKAKSHPILAKPLDCQLWECTKVNGKWKKNRSVRFGKGKKVPAPPPVPEKPMNSWLWVGLALLGAVAFGSWRGRH